MPTEVLALDIGGANLKAAHSGGTAWHRPFPLWKNPAGLTDALAALLHEAPPFDRLAVTMTGELCDCYPTKRAGVHAILDAVEQAAGSAPVYVWQNDGRLVEMAEGRQTPLKAAAANWLALATFAGRWLVRQPGLLLDVGSTTTDIIPIISGRPRPAGRTDPERLRSRELVYTGVRRTPLCALLGGEGAAELFATTLDVYLILGDVPEDSSNRDTADGRPATRPAALARLARMVCADLECCTAGELQALARTLADRQVDQLREALANVLAQMAESPRAAVIAGSGEFLARDVLQSEPRCASLPVISLAECLGPEVSSAACAFALMTLAGGEADATA